MLVSIVLISYNQKGYIREALDGIRNQSVSPDEVIISDDCSIDGTQQEILEYVREHSLSNTWTILLNNKNLGINGNLQNAINHTRSEIILATAGDDVCLPNRVEIAKKLFAKYPTLHIITTSIEKIDECGNYIGELLYNDTIDTDIKNVIIKGMPHIFPVGQMWRRSLFQKFGTLPTTVPNEDDQITFRGILDGGIFCSREKTMLYRVHAQSASSWLRNKQSDSDFYRRFLSDMKVRKNHMELWIETVNQIDRDDKDELIKMLNKKVSLYLMFENLSKETIWRRWMFLFTHNDSTGIREKLYILLGKTGVLLWRKVKILMGRI